MFADTVKIIESDYIKYLNKKQIKFRNFYVDNEILISKFLFLRSKKSEPVIIFGAENLEKSFKWKYRFIQIETEIKEILHKKLNNLDEKQLEIFLRNLVESLELKIRTYENEFAVWPTHNLIYKKLKEEERL